MIMTGTSTDGGKTVKGSAVVEGAKGVKRTLDASWRVIDDDCFVAELSVKGPDGVATGPTPPPTPLPGYLATSGSLTIAGSGASSHFEGGVQLSGDCNNDNRVNISDFNLMSVTFGKVSTGQGYDGRADYDGNLTISLVDFNLLKNNFGASGANPVRPQR